MSFNLMRFCRAVVASSAILLTALAVIFVAGLVLTVLHVLLVPLFIVAFILLTAYFYKKNIMNLKWPRFARKVRS